MKFGRQPLISEAAVQAVLDTLAFHTSQKIDVVSLQYLFLVEEKIINPKTPHSEKQRLYAIQSIILEIITDQLKHLRSKFQRELNVNETYQDAVQSLSTDAQIQSNDLISWSILYYLYVQVDLGFSIDSIAEIIGVASRTVRRYRTYGVNLLTQQLWESEASCRLDYHYKEIYSQLKMWNHETFIGRDEEINQIIHNIVDNQTKVIYVYGEKGIGKTSFIQKTIAKLMEHITIDDLLWVNHLKTTEITRLRQHYLANNPDISLSSVFHTFNCIIVLDGIDDLLKTSGFKDILSTFQGAIIFISSDVLYAIDTSAIHVPLKKLNQQISENLIKNVFDQPVRDETIYHIQSLSNGNPDKIKYLTNYHKYSLPSNSLEDLIGGLKIEQRILLVFIPVGEGMSIIDIKKISSFFQITNSDIEFLLSLELITQSQSRIYSQIEPDIIAHTLSIISSQVVTIIDKIAILDEPWIVVTHLLTSYYKWL
jgi:hypothetical protein